MKVCKIEVNNDTISMGKVYEYDDEREYLVDRYMVSISSCNYNKYFKPITLLEHMKICLRDLKYLLSKLLNFEDIYSVRKCKIIPFTMVYFNERGASIMLPINYEWGYVQKLSLCNSEQINLLSRRYLIESLIDDLYYIIGRIEYYEQEIAKSKN